MIRNDVKPALMAAIDSEFSKNPKRDPGAFTPARTSKAASDAVPKAGSGGAAKAASGGANKGELQVLEAFK